MSMHLFFHSFIILIIWIYLYVNGIYLAIPTCHYIFTTAATDMLMSVHVCVHVYMFVGEGEGGNCMHMIVDNIHFLPL